MKKIIFYFTLLLTTIYPSLATTTAGQKSPESASKYERDHTIGIWKTEGSTFLINRNALCIVASVIASLLYYIICSYYEEIEKIMSSWSFISNTFVIVFIYESIKLDSSTVIRQFFPHKDKKAFFRWSPYIISITICCYFFNWIHFFEGNSLEYKKYFLSSLVLLLLGIYEGINLFFEKNLFFKLLPNIKKPWAATSTFHKGFLRSKATSSLNDNALVAISSAFIIVLKKWSLKKNGYSPSLISNHYLMIFTFNIFLLYIYFSIKFIASFAIPQLFPIKDINILSTHVVWYFSAYLYYVFIPDTKQHFFDMPYLTTPMLVPLYEGIIFLIRMSNRLLTKKRKNKIIFF